MILFQLKGIWNFSGFMTDFPRYSIKGALLGRRLLGVSKDESIVCVEGKSDKEIYCKFVNGKKRILAVNELSGAKIDGGRDEVVLYSKQYPNDYFIIDDDFRSAYIDNYQKDLPKNLATTFEYNDIEIWCFNILYSNDLLKRLDLNKEDITLSLKLAKKHGIIRFITNRKQYFNPNTRWLFKHEIIRNQIFKIKPVLDFNFDILDFIYKYNDCKEYDEKPMISFGKKKQIKLDQWSETVSKEEIKSNGENSLKYVNGHDLTFYLYCIKTMRNDKSISKRGWGDFEYRFRKEAIKDVGYWKGFLADSKIGGLLLS